ncbi:MAG TPA: fatty acid desaturase [Marinagarivorans sp.]
MIRYKQDIPAIFLVLALFAAQLVLFFLIDNLYIVALCALLMTVAQGSATAVNHNQQHLPIFKSGACNRLFEVALFFNTGCGPWAWVLHHTLGHHMNYLGDKEDTCSWRRKDGSTMGAVEYTVINTFKVYSEIFRVGKQHPKILKKFKFWLALCLTLLATFIVLSPVKALIIFIVPMVIQLFLLVYATVDHHRGLDTQNPYEATRNDATKINNWYAWNLGYHTAHHVKCGLHWSKLPAFHEQIRQQIPDGLVREV